MIVTLSFFNENIHKRYIVLLAEWYTNLCQLTEFVPKSVCPSDLYSFALIVRSCSSYFTVCYFFKEIISFIGSFDKRHNSAFSALIRLIRMAEMQGYQPGSAVGRNIGYFFSVKDRNLFHRVDTVANTFTSGAASVIFSWKPSVIFSLVAEPLVEILPTVSTRWNKFRSFTEKKNILFISCF